MDNQEQHSLKEESNDPSEEAKNELDFLQRLISEERLCYRREGRENNYYLAQGVYGRAENGNKVQWFIG